MLKHPDPRRFLLWFLLCCVFAVAPTLAEVAVPALRARVTDLTQTLTFKQRQALEHDLAELETQNGAQVAVLIVATTAPETIEQYARRVLDEWKLGRKGVDDGALLLVAKDVRKLRIETQYGLEGVIPDAVAKRIITEDITPAFKRSDYYGGISAGVGRLIGLVGGEPLPPPPPSEQKSGKAAFDNLAILLVFVALAFGARMRRLVGPLLAGTLSGGLAGGVIWMVTGFIPGFIVGVIVFFFTMNGKSGGWSSGGGGRNGGSGSGFSDGDDLSGGGGGGDFSGGGGSGGGGGASGSW